MISSIFLPQRIGSYYLLKKRVLGIEIMPNEILASVITIKGRTRTLETVISEQLPELKEERAAPQPATAFSPETPERTALETTRTVSTEKAASTISAVDTTLSIQTIQQPGQEETVLTQRPVQPNTRAQYDERVIQALRSLRSKLTGTFDEVKCTVPSTTVIFKELTLPFVGHKKIKMVIPFEVESQLPFTLDAAVIDSIITHENIQQKETDVFVAAVKHETIDHLNSLFDAANFPLDVLTVDMFELYGLYKKAMSTNQTDKSIALIDCELYSTRVALIIAGQLKHVRIIPQGLIAVAKKLSALNGQETTDNLHHLLARGIAPNHDALFAQQAQQAMSDMLSSIQFTITNFSQRLKPEETIISVVLTGSATEIGGFEQSLHTMLNLPVQIWQPKQLLKNGIIESKTNSIASRFMNPIALAFDTPLTQDFNLNQEKEHQTAQKRLSKQLLGTGALIASLFFIFSTYSFFRLRTLRLAQRAAEQEAIGELSKNFKLKPSQTTNLEAAHRAASQELRKQESAWHRLSTENRYAMLRNLTELSRCINMQETQLDLATLILKEDSIRMYGSVPGFQQLTKLQSNLECPLFKKLPKLQNWNFRSEPITLMIQKEE